MKIYIHRALCISVSIILLLASGLAWYYGILGIMQIVDYIKGVEDINLEINIYRAIVSCFFGMFISLIAVTLVIKEW